MEEAALSTDNPYLIAAAHYAAGEHLRIQADAGHGHPIRQVALSPRGSFVPSLF